MTKKFAFYTPYQFAGNKPIWCLDMDGLEDVVYLNVKGSDGNTTKTVIALPKTGSLGHGALNLYGQFQAVPGKGSQRYQFTVDQAKTGMEKEIGDVVWDKIDQLAGAAWTAIKKGIPLQTVILGAGDEANNKGNEMDPNKHTLVVDQETLDMLGIILESQSKKPGEAPTPRETRKEEKEKLKNNTDAPEPAEPKKDPTEKTHGDTTWNKNGETIREGGPNEVHYYPKSAGYKPAPKDKK